MKRRILAILLVVFSLGTTVAHASSNLATSNEKDRINEMNQQIDELSSLAAEAARDGNYELAYAHEEQLRLLGVEISTEICEQDIQSGESVNEDGISTLTTVDPPEDTSAVHWYKYTYNWPYINGKTYEIIRIRAVSWDDTSEWLHVEGSITSKVARTFVASAINNLISVAVGASPVGALYTVLDLMEAVSEDLSSCQYLTVGLGGITCNYYIDVAINFYWTREKGSNDSFVLTLKENHLTINYAYIITVRKTAYDGSIETLPDTGRITGKTYTGDNYNDLDVVCELAAAGLSQRENNAGAVVLTLATNESVTVPQIDMPLYMEYIS